MSCRHGPVFVSALDQRSYIGVSAGKPSATRALLICALSFRLTAQNCCAKAPAPGGSGSAELTMPSQPSTFRAI
jgi:hypothetical protein